MTNNLKADFQKNLGTWIIWPTKKEIWLDSIKKAKKVYLDVILALAKKELVILVVDEKDFIEVNETLKTRVCYFVFKTNDSWSRDSLCLFIEKEKEIIALNFAFNGWGEKFMPFNLDNSLCKKLITQLDRKVKNSKFVLEGGAISHNGKGIFITTKSCLLDKKRNQQATVEYIEKIFKKNLSAKEVHFLEQGLEFDLHTDGHIDNVISFIDEKSCFYQSQNEKTDKENLLTLENIKINNKPLEIIKLPKPKTKKIKNTYLPLSYANLYQSNTVVLVPKFNDKNDQVAFEIIKNKFKEKEVIAIDALSLVAGGGGIHCITCPFY